MALPKEPRQKMINMMYLVLTALLALNVSSEILNAFKTVDQSLMNANNIINQKNEEIFASFEAKLKDEKTRERASIWKPKADEVKRLADEVYAYIDALKLELKKGSGLDEQTGKYKEDNLDAATRILVEPPSAKGKELLAKLQEFKTKILALDPEIKKEFENSLPIDLSIPKTDNKGNNNWESAYFRMTPTIAALTMLSKFQNDVRNAESQVVDFCHQQVGAVQLVYDEFQAFAGTNSQYLMPGQELVITAGVGAFSKAARPTISIDGKPISLNAQGVAEFKTAVGGPGSYKKKVSINFIKPDGTTASLTKDIEYTVGSPTGASVSADAVKVLYIGLDNPLTISGGTKGDEAVSVKIDNGSIKKLGGGKYIANVEDPGTANIIVTVDGKSTPFTFKVKRVPPPLAMVGTSKGGRIAANQFKYQSGVRAELENFVFEGVKFTVSSFTMYFTGKGFTEKTGIVQNNGAYFNAEAKNLLEKSTAGTSITIDDIVVVGPGGIKETLPPIVFNLF